MRDYPNAHTGSRATPIYQIRIRGHLGQQWSDWFDGLTVKLEANGETLLTGPVVDQPALHGLLKKVRDAGLPLISVNRIDPDLAVDSTEQREAGIKEHVMKAVRQPQYGGPEVLQVQDVEIPTPKDHQVLIKVHAASINAGDWRGMRGRPLILRAVIGGFLRPKDPRMGSDVAGVVEAVGEEVTRFRPGAEVFGCAKGSFAEYVLAREAYIAPKPAGVTFEQAAAIPVAGLTALQGLRHAGIRKGQKVAIQGASGGVGIFAVQLAKHFGAEVTAVCSPRNVEMARLLGADHVIDYTREDFTRSRDCYDLIFAVNGYHSLSDYKRALKPQGTYVCAGGAMRQFFAAMLLGPRLSKKGGKKLGSMGIAKVVQEDLITLGELLKMGTITPVIDRSYNLEAIAEAIGYVEEKHPQGKVTIKVR